MTYGSIAAALLLWALLFFHCSAPRNAAPPLLSQDVPPWLFTALQRHLDNPSVLEQEDISYSYVWLRPGERPQVVASARLDRLNGVFAVYEYTGTAYREVYVKLEPVYELSVAGHRRQVVLLVSGFGGTGVQNNFYHLVGYTGGRYAELWSGVAYATEFTGPLPHTYTTGALRLDPGHTHFVYTKTTLRYQQHEFEWNKPSGQETTAWLYTLDPETLQVKDSTRMK